MITPPRMLRREFLCALAEFFGIGAVVLWYESAHALLGEPTPIAARGLPASHPSARSRCAGLPLTPL